MPGGAPKGPGTPRTPESIMDRIEQLIDAYGERTGMDPESIDVDIISYAPHEENETPNFEYLTELAEELVITPEEMYEYAINRFELQKKGEF